MINHLNKKFLQDWMYLLGENISETRLVDLISPGSHNSNSYTINSGIKNKFVRNQHINIKEQLDLGIRLLDLRYGIHLNNKVLVDQHGPEKGDIYIYNFIQVKDFLEKHPKEFIIISIQAEEKITSELKTDFKKKIDYLLKDYLINKKDAETWFDLKKVTIGDIWKTKKRIFLVYHPYKVFFEKDDEKIGIFSDEGNFESYWHDVMEKELLFDSNLKIVEKRKKNNFNNLIFVNQFIMTVQRNFSQVFKKILFFDIPTINNFVYQILKNKKLHYFLLNNKDKSFNYLLFDLIHTDINLLLITISLNIKKNTNFKILKSWISGECFRDEIDDFIFHNNSIYITDMDIIENKLDHYKNLVVLYKYQNQLCFYSTEKIENVYIFDNPLVRYEFVKVKGFCIFMSSYLIFKKIIYNENDDFFNNIIEKYEKNKEYFVGLYFYKNKLYNFK